MDDHPDQSESLEEGYDDETVHADPHNARSIDQRADMFNMSHLGDPFIPLNTPTQLLQPRHHVLESVRAVLTDDPTQTYWFGDCPHGEAKSVRSMRM